MKIAGCYIRVSSDDQTEYSPDAQLRQIREYCEKNKIFLDENHIYKDEGISGRKAEKRPQFMEMIKNAKRKPKPFDVLLVHKLDRFARNREDSIVYKAMLRKECDIKVVSITENIEDDKFGVILEAMLEAMAEYYSLNLSDEVKKGQHEKARRGGNVNKLPFGYKPDGNGGIEVVEDEAKVIRIVFDRYLNGLGRRKISQYLLELGITDAVGKPFSQERIEYIINNPVYAGYIRRCTDGSFNRDWDRKDVIISKGHHTPIIDHETWDKVQAIIKERKQYLRKFQKKFDDIHWLMGLVKCSNCGGSLVRFSPNKKRPAFQCSAYHHGKCKVSHSISIWKVEDGILDILKKTFEGKVRMSFSPPKIDTQENEILTIQLNKLNEKMDRIKLAYENGIDDLEEYRSKKSDIIKERELLLTKIENNKPIENVKKAKEFSKTVYETLLDPTIDMQSKYDVAHTLIDTITFVKEKQELHVKYHILQ